MAFETINLGTQPAGTGGDTARSAFEKTNRNFLAAEVLSAAMSQAQFEAIRLQNKERYDASGWASFGKHISDGYWTGVNQGIWVSGIEKSKTIRIGANTGNSTGLSKTLLPFLNIAGIEFKDLLFNEESSGQPWSNVKFQHAPDGKKNYNKSTGVITTHATVTAAFNAQAADSTNVEVVIERIDMWGVESWLEEVSTTKPYVYPNGIIQSQATMMDGITTSESARPITYYSVFDGDANSKGKGINFFSLSDAQKKKVLANHKNKLYYLDDGRLVQWRLRVRSFSGYGNGDWEAIDSAKNINEGSNYCYFKNQISLIKPQGIRDNPLGSEFAYPLYGGIATADVVPHAEISIYAAHSGGSSPDYLSSVNGECFFLVCGTLNRLNQGLYHPSYNPFGSSKAVGDTYWYNTIVSITSRADCFDPAKILAGSGSIASGKSGRPDGRYYDAVYPDGQGGICRDMRYPAYGLDESDYAEADRLVKNGTYRGFEKTKLTTASSSVDSNVSVGGNFLVTEVIATNAVINATAELSVGWSGFKNALSPTGSISVFELSRDAISTPTALRSTNNGASWSAFTPVFNAANNSVTLTNEPAANIVILQYQAFSTQTEPAPNAALAGLVPYNVFASSDYRPENGALLGESLIGKVLKNNAGVTVNNKSLLSCAIDSVGKLTSVANFDGVTHQALTLGAPANNSPAFKAVSYLANINQQAVPHFAYTELRHNGTSFGDDGKQTIVDNQSTKPNDHGVTVVVGTARLREPLGWFKNKV